MTTTLVFWMASGDSHTVELPTDQAEELVARLAETWFDRRAGTAPTLHLADGTSTTINPHHVESVVRR